MLRLRPSSLLLVPVLALVPALTLFACAGESPEDDPAIGLVREPIPAGDNHFVGTYTNIVVPEPGDLTMIVLKKDGTFHAETFITCVKEPCYPIAEDGNYSLLRQRTTTYINLYLGGTDVLLAKYQYELHGDFLNLRLMSSTADGTWMSLQRSPTAWCATHNDCAQQDLIPGPCAGQYLCTSTNACSYHCGVVPEDAAQ